MREARLQDMHARARQHVAIEPKRVREARLQDLHTHAEQLVSTESEGVREARLSNMCAYAQQWQSTESLEARNTFFGALATWHRKHADFHVCRDKVLTALQWLQKNN